MSARDWQVDITQQGPAGTVTYREPNGTIGCYWEFGGGDVVASISAGTTEEWGARYPWAVARRDEILRRIMEEVVRQRAPGCTAALGERGWINIYEKGKGPPSAATFGGGSGDATGAPPSDVRSRAAADHFAFTQRRSRIVGIFGLVVVALAGVAWIGRSVLTVRTTGSPLSPSMRVGKTIATLTTRLEAYVPTLNRSGGDDRFTVGLLLHNVEDGKERYIELAQGRRPGDTPLMRLDTSNGSVLWAQVPEEVRVDIESGRVTSHEELTRDPSLSAPRRARSLAELGGSDRLAMSYLAAGGIIPGNRWLGLHVASEIPGSYRQGFRAPNGAPFEWSSATKHIYAGSLTTNDGPPRFQALTDAGGDSLFDAALVRATSDGEILTLAGDGWLMLHQTKAYRSGHFIVSRLDADGKVVWSTDSGLGVLTDILPDASWPAFIGTRPRIPDQLSEPLLVVVDARTGRLTTHSLWLKD